MAETDNATQVSSTQEAVQPGSVITPAESVNTQQAPAEITRDAPVAQTPAPSESPSPTSDPPLLDSNEPPIYDTGDDSDPEEVITWSASEFVAHQKSVGWYGLLALVTIVIAGLVYILIRDVISTSVVVICAIILGIYAARQPRQLSYRLDEDGVTVGNRQYSYNDFRSFAVVPEGAFSSIVFMPLRRFSPLTTLYYAPEDEDRIVDLLGDRLPLEDYTHDPVERLMHRIRF
jgi:hypothetical protein